MLHPGWVVLQVSEVTFDVSILDVYTTLACDCTVSMMRPIGLMDPHHVLDTIAEHGVHFAFFVPSVLRVLVQEVDATQLLASAQALSAAVRGRGGVRPAAGQASQAASCRISTCGTAMAGGGHRSVYDVPARRS